MKKIRLVSFLLVAVLSTAACGGSDREPFTPDNPKRPNSRAATTMENPIRLLPAVTVAIWCFTLRARTIPGVWRN